jgi:flavin reductase (DIM6/NTAB) family NADH-FMN oxidoreductase RutF
MGEIADATSGCGEHHDLMSAAETRVALSTEAPIWTRFFSVAPLVVIGTRDPDGRFNLAPKHMATPLGWENYYGFVCTPSHSTYRNAVDRGEFTVSFPRPGDVLHAALSAGAREEDGSKPIVEALPAVPACTVDAPILEGAYLVLECELERTVDGFGANSLVAGRVVAASVDPAVLRDPEEDDHELIHRAPLLVYLHPDRFAPVSESFSFPLPLGFGR